MLYDVLNILKTEADKCFTDPDSVSIGDITKTEGDTSSIDNKIVITLLNTEEEPTLKNSINYTVENGTVSYQNRSAYLNLYVMFSAHKSTYEHSLKDISEIIKFFKSKPVFTDENTPDTGLNEFKFRVNLHPLPFEQLSYVWGVLGGKAMPSALYKVSIIKLQKTGEIDTGTVIDTIEVESEKV